MSEELQLTKPDDWFECWEWNCHERSTAMLHCDHVLVATTCPTHAATALALLRKHILPIPLGEDREWSLSEIRR